MESEAKEKRRELYRRNEVRRLVTYLLKGTGILSPERDPNSGEYVFPSIPGVESDPSPILKELAKNGVLEEFRVTSVPSCPNRLHTNAYVDYRCPFCKKDDLEKGTIVEHYECGHTDLESKFKSGNNLVCPKCTRTLKLLGTDYRRMENINRCRSCGRYFGAPMVQMSCRVCGDTFLPEEAQLKPVYGYRIVEKLRSELLAYCSLEAPLGAVLKELGYEVEAPYVEKGFSGIEYVYDIFASTGKTEIVVDIASGVEEVAPDSIAAFFAKVYDSKSRRAILVVMPRLSREAERLATLYRIEHTSGESLEDLLKQFKAKLGTAPVRAVGPETMPEEIVRAPLARPAQRTTEVLKITPPVSDEEVSLNRLSRKMEELIKESE